MTFDPKETLTGGYSTGNLTLADGTSREVLVRMVPVAGGESLPVIVDDAARRFDERFYDTATRPDDFVQPDTQILTPKTHTSPQLALIEADMVAFLGDPDHVLAQGRLDTDRLAHLHAHPSSATLARRICTNMGGKWRELARLIPQTYPDRP